ncbi:hypothetical protein [Streptomyces sp. NPDC059262]|uniref:hypothetical protein n=1 Tax=Streptomyces sp. NPDC059262 TaxID=3346797 RepID=UPI0036A9B825
MPFGEAMDIARDLGATVSHQAGAEQPPGQYVLTPEDSRFQFVLFFPEDRAGHDPPGPLTGRGGSGRLASGSRKSWRTLDRSVH